jgi:hypothetical protein
MRQQMKVLPRGPLKVFLKEGYSELVTFVTSCAFENDAQFP